MKQRVRGLAQAGLASVGMAVIMMLVAGGTASAGVCERPGYHDKPRPSTSGNGWDSNGNTGVGDGNQLGAPLQVPGDLACNGLGIGGVGIGACPTKNPGGYHKPPKKRPPIECTPTPSAPVSSPPPMLPVTGSDSVSVSVAVALLLLTAGGVLVYAARRRGAGND